MKKIFIYASALLLICGTTGCTKNFEEYNTDPYMLYVADPPILMPTMIDALMYVQQNDSQMIDQMVGSLGGYFTLSNRWGGQNFDTFNASDSWNATPYNTMFEDIYANYFDIKKATDGSGHYFALAQVIRAAVMMRVADCYGPIPYSQVTDGSFYVPYDSAEDVYKQIIEDLTNAASVLYNYSTAYPSSQPVKGNDLLFDGDYAAWARLANSLALRAAVRTGNAAAAQAITAHPAGLIEENSQNAMMDPGVQGNPYQLAAASWGDLRANASIVDYMTGYSDPRLQAYFKTSSYNNSYLGMRAGSASFQKDEVAGYSQPNVDSGSKLPVFVAAETAFLRAEMVVRGWISGNAKSYYEQGVRLSMQQWGVGESSITNYLANNTATPANHTDTHRPIYNYTRSTKIKILWNESASTEEKIERIITQKWIANYPMGLEAWAEFRRTGYPELAPAVDNLSDGVIANTATGNFRGLRRLRYPYTEHNLNAANVDAAVTLLGGEDNEATDLFWAKKN
ncbi:MAG: SusD/RagB family nutrient-binding outer membrane lipoprotein [Alistipes sp.]|nr:SusD/RagB family nutrient-binding outer membrane lipoprotein [Alistipes sp.]